MKISQGTILPTTGIGVGYLLLFIYGILAWNVGVFNLLQVPASYILLLLPALMQFSYKDFIVDDSNKNNFTIRYRILFFIPINTSFSFSKYEVYVLRVMNKSYNVMQSATGGMTSGKHKEEYFAIIGRDKKSKEHVELCKGSKSELDQIINKYIEPLGIPVYLGAPKKGYEYVIKED